MGIALNDQGKYDEAIECYDKVIEINSEDEKAWYNKGLALKEQGKCDEAIECYNKAIEINPEYGRAWNNKGVALNSQGKSDEAIECYDMVIEINSEGEHVCCNKRNPSFKKSKYDDIDEGKEWCNKGKLLQIQGRLDDAIECYNKAIKINPKNDGAWYIKGLILKQQGNLDKAIECYDKTIEIKSENENVWYNKENALSEKNKLSEVDEEIEWFNKGNTLQIQGKLYDAKACYNKAIEINPENDVVWYIKGIVLEQESKFDEAIKCYDKVIEIDSGNKRAWYNKAVILMKQNKFDEVIKCYFKAIEINTEVRTAWSNKANILEKLDKLYEAIKCYNKTLPILKNSLLPNIQKTTYAYSNKIESIYNTFSNKIVAIIYNPYFNKIYIIDFKTNSYISGKFNYIYHKETMSDKRKNEIVEGRMESIKNNYNPSAILIIDKEIEGSVKPHLSYTYKDDGLSLFDMSTLYDNIEMITEIMMRNPDTPIQICFRIPFITENLSKIIKKEEDINFELEADNKINTLKLTLIYKDMKIPIIFSASSFYYWILYTHEKYIKKLAAEYLENGSIESTFLARNSAYRMGLEYFWVVIKHEILTLDIDNILNIYVQFKTYPNTIKINIITK